ncbi:MAG: 50S ribosomal protein L11 [Pseudonocardia sp.]|nr:50S ribosomal protein L11 [Pseudonocardia sp.]
MELSAGEAAMMELGKMLGQTGVNLVEVKRRYDDATSPQRGDIVPAVIVVHDDRSFDMTLKTPPTAFLIRRVTGAAGSSRPGHNGGGTLTREQLRSIAERKLPDLNTTDVGTAMRIVGGTARSMGVRVADG